MSIQRYDNGFRVFVYVGPLAERMPSSLRGRARLTKVVPTLREAKALEREWEAAKELARQHEGVTVASWHTTYMAMEREASTQNKLTYALRPFVTEHGDKLISDFTPQMVKADAASRAKNQNQALRTMFSAAVEHGVITFNPYREVKIVSRPTRQIKADYHEVWTDNPQEQIKILDRILEAAEQVGGAERGKDLRAKIAFSAWTGARPGEVRALHKDDLDLNEGFAYLRRTMAADGTVREATKSGLHRKVFIPAPAILELRAAAPHINTPYVFTNRGNPWIKNTFNNYWTRIRDVAGTPKMRFYDLRHFCATQLLEMGVDADDVARQLGHADSELVHDVYGHPSHNRALDRIRHTFAAHTDNASSQVRHINFEKKA